jgi:hypothetical protein
MLLGNGSVTRKLAENILFLKRLTNFSYLLFAAGLRKGYGELLVLFFTSQTIRAYFTDCLKISRTFPSLRLEKRGSKLSQNSWT